MPYPCFPHKIKQSHLPERLKKTHLLFPIIWSFLPKLQYCLWLSILVGEWEWGVVSGFLHRSRTECKGCQLLWMSILIILPGGSLDPGGPTLSLALYIPTLIWGGHDVTWGPGISVSTRTLYQTTLEISEYSPFPHAWLLKEMSVSLFREEQRELRLYIAMLWEGPSSWRLSLRSICSGSRTGLGLETGHRIIPWWLPIYAASQTTMFY